MLKSALRELYFGSDRKGMIFQFILLVLDVATIAFFLIVSFIHQAPWILYVDIFIVIFLILDFIARTWISYQPFRHLVRPVTIADMIVIASMLAPLVTENLAFFRILRAVRILRSYHVLGMLRRNYPAVRRNEDVIQSVINLLVFIFTVTAIVYVTQVDSNPEIRHYVDALYFTVTTLTTTGFGDITLMGEGGRLLAVLIMIFGISLFLRLVQTVFRPSKIKHPCEQCGLLRHEPDAVHCKHCGAVLDIPNEGD
jgi:voltage-gated potassium channel